MARDTFGGPSACHITHQSVGSGYLGPVTGTVAERAAWLIRLFLQIADQWLWVGRWIFPFPLSLLLFFSPFRSPLVPGRDVCDVSMRWTGWLTRAAGEAGWLAGWEIVTHTGVWHGRYTNTHTHLFPPPHTFFPPFLCAECISRCHTDGLCTASMKTQPINDIRRSLFPPGDPVDLLLARISLWITTVRETINQSSWKILTGFFLFHLQNILGLTIDRFSLKSRYLWRSFRKLIILHFPQCNMTVSCNTLCLKNGKFHVNALSNLKENSESWRKFWYTSLHCMMLKHGGRK